MSWIDWLIVAVPLFFVVSMAWYSRRFIRGVADFLAAGRVCGRYVISVSDVANALAVVTLVAQVEINYKTGFAIGFWSNIIAPIGLIISLTGYCTYRYRETRALSLGQFLEMRYSKSFRIFASGLRTFSETVCNMIVPAISARFFIYLLGLPHRVSIGGYEISTFAFVILIVLTLALFIIWCGGTVALIITDSIQALLCYPIFAIFVIFILSNFSWFTEIVPVMSDRVPRESFLNPYDIQSLRDFNVFALIVTVMSQILNQASWIGAGSTTAGKNPHEQKMAGVLGSWRNGFSIVFYFLIGSIILTVLTHVHFTEKSRDIRTTLSIRVADEMFGDSPQLAALTEAVNAIPAHEHSIGRDAPLSDAVNLDTPYMNAVRSVLGTDETGNANYQEFRTLYHQLMLPVSMRQLLPVGLLGLFVLLMVMLMISTDNSRIFSGAITTIQDIVLPLRQKPLSPQKHVLLLRLASIGIGVIFFCGSFFMAQLDYINLFCIITTSIWLGGAGPVMIGGLYSRFGNTAGAYASLIIGTVISGGGILVQRNWPDHIYPFLVQHDLASGVGRFLETVSSPFHPWIVWAMDPVKCPINSNEMFFISMVLGVFFYCLVSVVTYKKSFNLDRMLHRGAYNEYTNHSVTASVPIHVPWWQRVIGIDDQYTRGDKIIAWSVFIYSFVYTFLGTFVGVVVWNFFWRWPIEWWAYYFLFVSLLVPCAVAVVSTVWFTIGGMIDLIKMFRDLAGRVDNPLDDGRVDAAGAALADAAFDARVEAAAANGRTSEAVPLTLNGNSSMNSEKEKDLGNGEKR